MLALALVAATVISVDAAANRHPINPEIYGSAFAPGGKLPGAGATLYRWGGNATTRYNWQANASNRASDWYFESISDEGAGPSFGPDNFIALSQYQGSGAMITLPTIGWVAKLGAGRDKLASYSVKKYGPQQATDPFMPDAGNGVRLDGSRITNNDPTDANMPVDTAFQRGWIQHLSERGVPYIALDNEPSLWHETHRDVHPDAATMDEVAAKDIEAARLVKSVDPSMQVAGPEEWGWPAYFFSGFDQQWGAAHNWSGTPDRDAHGGVDYLPWLLDQFRVASEASGKRLLDVFTVHYYPQGGELSDDVSPAMQLRRNRSTRSLWDPSYHDESWIDGTVRLIPRMREWVNTHYPGTRIGITEYNWGAESYINGATTQADLFGIFGREGLDLATRWIAPPSGSLVQTVFWMYRNYDGKGHGFGDLSVAASVPNPDELSAFAAIRTSDNKLTVMIVNKAFTPATAAVNLQSFAAGPQAEVWQLTSINHVLHLNDVPATHSGLSLDVPAQSITLLVIPPATSAAPHRRSARH